MVLPSDICVVFMLNFFRCLFCFNSWPYTQQREFSPERPSLFLARILGREPPRSNEPALLTKGVTFWSAEGSNCSSFFRTSPEQPIGIIIHLPWPFSWQISLL